VLTPCFYALNLPRTPMRIVMIGIAVNLALNFANMQFLHFGHAGLALATSCVVLANSSQLGWALSRKVDFGSFLSWAGFIARVGLAAGGCGAAAWVVYQLTETYTHGFLIHAFGLFAAIGLAMVAYVSFSLTLRIGETREAVQMVQRRLLRRRAKAAASG
jgi:putative peptidoglycan lipid II flippase